VSISREELLRLARGGAVARVQELKKELEKIYKTFPDLRDAKTADRTAAAKTRRREPGQRNWTAADRKAVSDRMRKYWAARRGTAGKAAKTSK
jgi:hypothetical protein